MNIDVRIQVGRQFLVSRNQAVSNCEYALQHLHSVFFVCFIAQIVLIMF